MSQAWVLGQRALREAWRTPDALLPTLFIPLFFLVVNVGQAAKIFPAASTDFLQGQGYGAFQLPSSLLLGASFGTAALFLVEEIEGGYFDKLRATPVSRSAIVLGRLFAEGVKCVFIASVIVGVGVSMLAAGLGSTLICAECFFSSASACFMASSSTWPARSMKKPYSHLAWCDGRDSMRFMLMPWRANGLSTSNNAPGLSWMKTSTEVRSWPDGGKMLRPMTRKRVVLSASSWMGLITTFFRP